MNPQPSIIRKSGKNYKNAKVGFQNQKGNHTNTNAQTAESAQTPNVNVI